MQLLAHSKELNSKEQPQEVLEALEALLAGLEVQVVPKEDLAAPVVKHQVAKERVASPQSPREGAAYPSSYTYASTTAPNLSRCQC